MNPQGLLLKEDDEPGWITANNKRCSNRYILLPIRERLLYSPLLDRRVVAWIYPLVLDAL